MQPLKNPKLAPQDPKKVNMSKLGNDARAAWKKGKKQVTLDGVVLKIRLLIRSRKVTTGGGLNKDYPTKEHKLVERWLVLSPADGEAVAPVYCFEETAGTNGVARSKK